MSTSCHSLLHKVSCSNTSTSALKPPTFPQKYRGVVAKFYSPKLNLTRSVFQKRIQYPNGSTSLRSLLRHRVSSNDAQFNSAPENNNQQQPSFTGFITSERVKVVAMFALALALCNADRVVMFVAMVPLSLVNGWGRAFSGIIQSSRLWGYLISPIETSLLSLLVVRALLGVAEGVALPSMNNMVARWFPQTERARVVGISMAGFQLGCVIGLTLSPILMSQSGIFGPFVIFGLSGFLWVLVWLSATSSTPDRSPQISKYELEYILSKRQQSFPVEANKVKVIPPFRRLLSKMPTWQAAWFSAIPWVVMAIMTYLADFLSDMMIQRGTSVTLTRKIMQSIGFVGPGVSLVGLVTARNPSIASAWLTLAFGSKSFGHSGFLVNFQDIAP
ncbi:hypothetical protein KIW84_058336 [Lathyrus oleraceus]|uniref:Anion transporter 4, chloroplastic n=1 Tax=Pisum sativum TaxID=3888 RepID=A0A9D4X8M2_PEA|nr:hypothetical protein KIW84_058336 [Pisum sativum]